MAIMNHEFFKGISFNDLLEKKMNPPFVPQLDSEFDLRYIPRTYKEQHVGESFSDPKAKHKSKKDKFDNFENFAYSEEG